MDREPRLATRAPDGQVLREYDAYSAQAARALEADFKSTLPGSVDFSREGKALYATDASNYRQVPLAVVYPRTRDEVIEAVRICREHDAPILARGGGTSLAGQGCNVAVCIDFSRHLHKVLEIDPLARVARVEPGCILDRLRDAAAPFGLTFGPDPATHDHNTLGGMIGNDSCGVHSVRWGRTADNVERLTIMTYDGLQMELSPAPQQRLERLLKEIGPRGDIYRALAALMDRYGTLIQQRFPKIPRLVSGFENLDALTAGRDFNVARAVTGTEGSCVLVLDAEVKLVPRPKCKAIALLSFASVFEAADAVPSLLAQEPDAVEGFDGKLYDAVRATGAKGLDAFPEGRGFLIVEAGGESSKEAQANVARMIERANTKARTRFVSDEDEQQRIWKAREASLGATAFVSGQPAHWPGWEDSAVPPEKLGSYLRDLEKLFDQHGYTAALYGHFGDGVTHCRINFDFHNETGLRNYRQFMREAAHLVHSYGGSLSGEHGDGQARAELLKIMFGDELMRCFREFKSIWDPKNRLNPGKAIEPFAIDSNLRLGLGYEPEHLRTFFQYPQDNGSFARATTRCVGVGKCRRRQVGDEVMCPSYLATGDEKHCTRGRAHLLHEMTRGEIITDGWQSNAVEDALSLCLACKGCKADCPVGVDVATWKAEFRAHHYARRLRPRSAYAMGFIDRLARTASNAPSIANLIARTKPAKWAAGIHGDASIPAFASQTFQEWFRKFHNRSMEGERVLLWTDTFNNFFKPQTLVAATQLLERAGYEVAIASEQLCCGRPLYDWGFLKQAKQRFERIFRVLREEIEKGTPILVTEPACTSVFKDELRNLYPDHPHAQRLSAQVHYIADFIADHIERFPPFLGGGRALVQPHCHHHAIIGFEKELSLLEHLKISAERPAQGCCGMAGAFGMARETFAVASKIGERALLPGVRELKDEAIILADGFSCREQIENHTERKTFHIVELLRERIQ